MRQIKNIVESPGAPNENEIWLDEDLKLKSYKAGKWKNVKADATDPADVESISYTELKEDMSAGKLVPGRQYRITDFVTTVNPSLTSAASDGHPFDVIVTALTENKLASEAKAARHEGDTYFPASTQFEKWELLFDINNDTTKYEWADATNGKGVIYFMRDEWGNEMWQDFKNIKTSDSFAPLLGKIPSFYFVEDDKVQEYSISCRNVKIGPVFADEYNPADKTQIPSFSKKRALCNSHFEAKDIDSRVFGITNIVAGIGFLGNHLAASYNCRFGDYCTGNLLTATFGDSLDDLSYSNNIAYGYDNILGKGCHDNLISFGWNNKLSDGAYSITISGTSTAPSYGNEFGKNSRSITLGKDARYNIFGEGIEGNSLGDTCHGNRFAAYSNNNTLGNSCSYNIFAEQCSGNTLPTFCRYITFAGNNNELSISKETGKYLWYLDIEKGLSSLDIEIDAESNYNNCVPRRIVRGVSASSYKVMYSSSTKTYILEGDDYHWNASQYKVTIPESVIVAICEDFYNGYTVLVTDNDIIVAQILSFNDYASAYFVFGTHIWSIEQNSD